MGERHTDIARNLVVELARRLFAMPVHIQKTADDEKTEKPNDKKDGAP